jgi:hypothetical protein
VSEPGDAAEVGVAFARALEHAGIDYAVGGSVASSAYGEPRATRDLDFALRLPSAKVPALLEALGSDFIIDEAALHEAIRLRGTVNLFYLPSFTKIDLFLRGDDEYDRMEFSRLRRIEPVAGEPVMASSAEDNLLWKLRWYRDGSEVSDQQWRDVLGLLRVSGGALDLGYLRQWAAFHGVSDLLERAMRQQGL